MNSEHPTDVPVFIFIIDNYNFKHYNLYRVRYMERIYNKLVRDNIPDIIKAQGETPITKILDDNVYKMELEKKLNEEYQEVLEASGNDRIEELEIRVEHLETGKPEEDIEMGW